MGRVPDMAVPILFVGEITYEIIRATFSLVMRLHLMHLVASDCLGRFTRVRRNI